MSLALQILPRPEEQCLNFSLAYEIAATVCSTSGFNFTEPRLTNIAIMFDALVCEGESPTTSMTTAMDIEIALRGNPLKPRALPKPQEQKPGFGLQRLSKDEESDTLILAEAAGLPFSELRCRFSRQQGRGVFRSSREFKNLPRDWGISYDLVLCEFCGNFEGMKANTPYCPARLRAFRAQLLNSADGQLTLTE